MIYKVLPYRSGLNVLRYELIRYPFIKWIMIAWNDCLNHPCSDEKNIPRIETKVLSSVDDTANVG